MRKFRSNSVVSLGLLLSAALVSSNALAQPQAQAARPLRLFVDRPLQIGLVTGTGSVTVPAQLNGTRVSSQGLTLLNGLPVTSAIVRAVGEPNSLVSIFIADLDRLYASGGDTVDFAFEDNLPGSLQLDDPGNGSDGSYTFYIGGTVTVRGTETAGPYAGHLVLNASYN